MVGDFAKIFKKLLVLKTPTLSTRRMYNFSCDIHMISLLIPLNLKKFKIAVALVD